MAYIIAKRHIRLLLMVICCFMTVPLSSANKPLDEKERQKLIRVVNQRFAETKMQGGEILKIGKQNVLVVIVGVKNGSNGQRIAQVKAARTAGEYLQAALNRSMTVYEIIDNTSYRMQDKAVDSGGSVNSVITSSMNQKNEDLTTVEKSEKFTDRIIQTSNTLIKNIQPLCNLGVDNGETIFAYFALIDN